MSALEALSPLDAIAGWVDQTEVGSDEFQRRAEVYDAFDELIEAVERAIDPEWSPRTPEECALRHARVVRAIDRAKGVTDLPTVAALARAQRQIDAPQQPTGGEG